MPNTGTLYLIPVPIADQGMAALSAGAIAITERLSHYFAEDARSARRFLRSLHPGLALESIDISVIDKHEGADFDLLKSWLAAGLEVGILSEAGCPGVADPGSELVAIAHRYGHTVIPLSGPSSILLALMASGLNGQSFAFRGYIPQKNPARGQMIRQLELTSQKEKQTQILIETPYRNNQLLNDLLQELKPETRLCIAQNLTAPEASVRCQTVKAWKMGLPDLGKNPAVFLFLV